MSSDTSATTSTIAVGTTKPPSNYGIQQTCKIDISKFPQYYFSLNDDAGGYSLVKYSCGISIILIILLVAYFINKNAFHYNITWIAIMLNFGLLASFVPAWAGFIILFNAAKDYQKLSKTIRIYNNLQTSGCIITTPGDNTGSKKVYLGTKDSINYIAFSSVLMILLYAIVCVLLFISLIYNFI